MSTVPGFAKSQLSRASLLGAIRGIDGINNCIKKRLLVSPLFELIVKHFSSVNVCMFEDISI